MGACEGIDHRRWIIDAKSPINLTMRSRPLGDEVLSVSRFLPLPGCMDEYRCGCDFVAGSRLDDGKSLLKPKISRRFLKIGDASKNEDVRTHKARRIAQVPSNDSKIGARGRDRAIS